MININLDSDDTGKIQLAVQQHIVPDWVYENSQKMIEREANQEKQQKKQRVVQQQVVEHIKDVPNNSTSHNCNKVVDDGPEL